MYRVSLRLVLALLLATGSTRSSPAEAPPPADSESVDRFAPLTAPVLEADERSRLAAGEVVVRGLPPSDADGIGVIVLGLVDAPPDQVWQVMSDCEEQDEFMPRITYAAVRDRDGDNHTCDLVVDLPYPAEDARAATRHHVSRLPDGGYQRRWELAPGDSSYHRNSGSWSVHPYADGRSSMLVNRIDLLPKSAVPVWILRAANARQAPASFDAIRKRVRERQTRGQPALE